MNIDTLQIELNQNRVIALKKEAENRNKSVNFFRMIFVSLHIEIQFIDH